MYNQELIWREIKKCHLDEEIRRNELMKYHTSWKIGGIADFFCIPSHQDQLNKILFFALKYNLPLYIMGNGSNILVPDEGIRGLVVKVARTIDKIEYSDKMIKVGAGILLPTLTKSTFKKSLSGLEFAAHIPGTLGGAIINNASFGTESMADIVSEITLFDYYQGNIKKLNKNQFTFHYRGIKIGIKKYIILGACLILISGDQDEIFLKIKKNYEQRRITQPINVLTAGCIFKNPPERSAGYLIEKSGAKGLAVGDAQVSEKHANFIVNRGAATAGDILQLIEKIENMVEETFGIKLEREINFIGFNQDY